jgi:hypothetical protein
MKKLQIWLFVNAAFSFVSAVSLLLFSSFLNTFMGITVTTVLPIIGINLLIFSLFTAVISWRFPNAKNWVRLISILDYMWVAGSLAILIMQLFNLTKNGYILLALVALAVGILGYNQQKNNT